CLPDALLTLPPWAAPSLDIRYRIVPHSPSWYLPVPKRRSTVLKPRILVTGATGKTGRRVVAELLQGGYRVRALVHREDGRSAGLKSLGAEIALAEMSDVERLADALRDVQRAYYC